jgi:ABC-type uncharacterized transport system substrate-binding protein
MKMFVRLVWARSRPPREHSVGNGGFMTGTMRRKASRVPLRAFAEAGALASYGSDFTELFRHAAPYVDRILRGEKPRDLPVQEPTRYELVVNLKTAKAMALTVPQTVLARADDVIE